MQHNPLLLPIAKILRNSPQAISEYDLFQQLAFDDNDLKLPTDPSSDLTLFRRHFLVMNALYQLQPVFWEEGLSLSISALKIELTPRQNKVDKTLTSPGADEGIRSYYLDWNEFLKSDQESVDTLLDSFWQRYYKIDEAEHALATLGLKEGTDTNSIRRRYQQLASQHHPDKGGDPEQFIKIREAYEVLVCIRQ